MLLYLVGYLGVGIVATFSLAIFHVSTAIRKGYDIDTINNVMNGINKESGGLIKYVFGWFIWPIRCVQFIRDLDLLYETYDQMKESN